ncbi:MAG: hypothetical protein J2P35_00745 [Actinobacteria bacterium]|nr:hypothetical protein [Actinomycetota bacterium]MBO0784564.1 hypothetical protein [Actinomycetota bacterium]MBO0816157.1 hypothetical protein [Actinomycetota bacterium]
MTVSTEPVTGQRSSAGAGRAFSILNGLVLLGVLLQGLWAGEFIGRAAGPDWLRLHQITAVAVVILALAAAILALATQRRHRGLVAGSAGLFVLLVIQTGIGQAISDGGEQALVAVHIPLAMLIMGLGVYLSIAAARSRRSSAPG